MMEKHFQLYCATKLWQKETSLPSVPTLSRNLDSILGTNGIQLGAITELIGLPGTGKTQLSLQLCAAVQIPESLGGLNAEALYIDTNTNFTIERFKEILCANLTKCKNILGDAFTIHESEALKRLHYVDAFGIEKFCAFIHNLATFLDQHPNIRLIVIDSIAFPFKEGVSVRQRSGLLFRLMAQVHRLAFEKRIAIVLTNEMSTRLGLSAGMIVGALGDGWAHRCNVRLLLSNAAGERTALLVKSNVAKREVARFQITREGIRDVE